LEEKLPAFLEGKFRPADNPQRLDLAQVCAAKKRYQAATGLYAAALAAEPTVADDLAKGQRYNAACAAALAAAGQGHDAGLDEKERLRLRQQALNWLRADLALWAKQADSGTPQARAAVQQQLRHWQQDSDLADVRDPAALARLPEKESAECEKL